MAGWTNFGYRPGQSRTPRLNAYPTEAYSSGQPQRLEEILDNLRRYGAGFPTGAARQQMEDFSQPQRISDAFDRRNAAPAEETGQPGTLLEQLLGMSTGGEAAGPNPYNLAIQELRRQRAQIGAQTNQNISDIDDWFGGLGGIATKGARTNKKASKGAKRDAKKFDNAVLSLEADPNVARMAAGTAGSARNYARGSAREQGSYDKYLIGDLAQREAYEKLVQQRLGAQAKADVNADIRKTKIERASQSGSSDMDNLFRVLGLLDQDTRNQILGVPSAGEDGFDRDARGDMSGILSALVGDVSETEFGNEEAGTRLQDILPRLREGVSEGGGFDLSDPRIRRAFQSWIYANLLPKYNTQNKEGTDYNWSGKGFSPLGG